VHAELQQSMNDLVGIIRRESEMTEALERLKALRQRASRVVVEGDRRYNPGWHLAIDLGNMLDVAECVARAALERQESRGGHTREDFPAMDPEWRRVNLVCSKADDGSIELRRQPSLAIDPILLRLFERSELEKYLTPEELAVLDDEQEQEQGAGAGPAVPSETTAAEGSEEQA
jgi:succinate dehydrogenase / fumarate reductase flavoprotein subunit